MNDSPTLADPFTVPTRHWHRLDDGRVQCDVCPRACRLHEGQRGAVLRAGPCPQPRQELYRHIDAANVDLKAFTEGFYHQVCAARLADVLDTLSVAFTYNDPSSSGSMPLTSPTRAASEGSRRSR